MPGRGWIRPLPSHPGSASSETGSRMPKPGGESPACLPLLAWWDGSLKSLSDQLPPDLLMSLELARVQPFADLVAMVAKRWTALDEEINHVIIERGQGITPLTFSFEHHSLRASGSDDLADWRFRVTD